jgi:hypothetical protein
MTLLGRSFTTEEGERITVAADPSPWSEQYVDCWIDASDGRRSYSARPRGLVLTRLNIHPKGVSMARTRTPKPGTTDTVVSEQERVAVAERDAGTAKPKTPSTAEVAGRWILAALVADPSLDRKQLGERADAGNPTGEDALNGKAVVEAGRVGELMPGNRVGHYFAEGFSWLHEHRTELDIEELPLIETKRGSQTTFTVREPEPEPES